MTAQGTSSSTPPPPPQPPGASTPPPPPPAPPAAPPAASDPPPAAKKKRSPLLWIAGGCAAIVVIGFLITVAGGIFLAKKGADYVEKLADDPSAAAMMVAENIVRINPDLELVDSDSDTKTLTVRNKETGEEMTLSLEDIENGHIGFDSDEGKISMDLTEAAGGGALTITKDGEETFRIGASNEEDLPGWIPVYPDSAVEGVFSMTADGTQSGAFTLTSDDSVAEVLDFYASQFGEEEWDVRRTTFSSEDSERGQLSIENNELGTGLTITASADGNGTQAAVNYRSKE